MCGRIRINQLSAVNQQLQASTSLRNTYWKRWILGILLFASVKAVKAQPAGTKTLTEQTPTPITMGKVIVSRQTTSIVTLQGQVIDHDTHLPIPGVIIFAGNYHTTTDANGNFTLQAPVGTPLLQAKSIGYSTQTVKLKKKKNQYNIKIKPQAIVLGGLAAIRKPHPLKSIYTRVLDSTVVKSVRS